MPTVRVIHAGALRLIQGIALGDDPVADELATGLEEFQNLTLELHDGLGPMIDVDLTAATYVAGENQRIRVQDADTATITLPNSVPAQLSINPNDYGFSLSLTQVPVAGSIAVADGITYRQPRDMTRVEIVGTTEGLYFYRADSNTWVAALDLTIDSESPFNARYTQALSALLAERLMPFYPPAEITPPLAMRLRRARAAIFLRPGTAMAPTMAEYL